MSGHEGGAGDDFVADLLQGVEDVVGLRAELQPPAPLVPVLGGRAGLNTESSNLISNSEKINFTLEVTIMIFICNM